MASNLMVICQLRTLGGAVCQNCLSANRELRIRQENRTTIYITSVIYYTAEFLLMNLQAQQQRLQLNIQAVPTLILLS